MAEIQTVKYEERLMSLERFARENWPKGAKAFDNFAALTALEVAQLVAAARIVVESDLLGHIDLAAALDALDEAAKR